MFCVKCGFELLDHFNFCPRCGTRKGAPQHATIETKTGGGEKKDKRQFTIENFSQPTHTARKEKEAMYFGLIVSFVGIVAGLVIPTEEILIDKTKSGFLIAGMLIRLVAVLWIIGIAGRLNRNKISWAIFAFFFPGIALIIIGNLTTPVRKF